MQPLGRGVAQRLQACVETVRLTGRRPGGREEVREVAAGRHQGGQQSGLTVQPGPGFGTPLPEDRGATPVPQPVETQNGFPECVRPGGHPHLGKVHPGHMDTQHRTPTYCTRNFPPHQGMRTVTGRHHGVSARGETSRSGPPAPEKLYDVGYENLSRPEERVKAVGGFARSAAVGAWCGSVPDGGKPGAVHGWGSMGRTPVRSPPISLRIERSNETDDHRKRLCAPLAVGRDPDRSAPVPEPGTTKRRRPRTGRRRSRLPGAVVGSVRVRVSRRRPRSPGRYSGQRLSLPFDSAAARPASRRATGIRNGEQET